MNFAIGRDVVKGTAGCIAVGSELLGDAKLDLNSLEITQALERYGFDVVEKRVVGDNIDRIAGAVRQLLATCEVVIVTGGLGPTADDVTRQAVAAAVGRPLVHDPEVEAWIFERYEKFGRVMPAIGRSMAMVVEGSQVVRNSTGSAPGIIIEDGNSLLVVLPGVPWEMRSMIVSHLEPLLRVRGSGLLRQSRTLLIGGVVESDAEQRVSHLYDRFGREDVTILASYGVLRLVLTASGEQRSVAKRLDQMETAFKEVLGSDVVGVDVPDMAQAVVQLLMATKQTVATAESCTGGLVGAALTSVSGSSEAFMGGVISYSNDAKETMLGVPRQLLVDHGAVSEQVARAMAEGVKNRFSTNWGLAVTGIAGPTGGSEEKPVGLVHWAVAGPEGTAAHQRVFIGDRPIVRQWSVNVVLDLLRRNLMGSISA